MKSQTVFTQVLMLLCISGALLFTSSCQKEDPKLAKLNLLEGEWEVISFTEDGQEDMGNYIDFLEMDFKEYNEEQDEGDMKWTTIYHDGETEVSHGEYEYNADSDELEIVFRNNGDIDGSYEFDMTLEEKKLRLEATIDGFRYIIIAEK